MSGVQGRVAARYAAARTDAALLSTALWVEEVTALAYAALDGVPFARRFAGHEREHAAALGTQLQALTVPVRRHARPRALDALLPGLRDADRRDALEMLAELERAAIAGHQVLGRRLQALGALRTVAEVMGGAAQHLVVIRDALGREPLGERYDTRP